MSHYNYYLARKMGLAFVMRSQTESNLSAIRKSRIDELRTEPATPPKVLIVDDSDDDRAITCRCIRRLRRPLEILEASNGEEALGLADAGLVPALCITDLEMPRLDGIELIGRLRSRPDWIGIPIVLMSDRAETARLKLAYLAGINSFIRKPIEYDRNVHCLGRVANYWIDVNFRLH